MGPMHLPWATWAIYPFMAFLALVTIVWSYLLKKKLDQEGDDL